MADLKKKDLAVKLYIPRDNLPRIHNMLETMAPLMLGGGEAVAALLGPDAILDDLSDNELSILLKAVIGKCVSDLTRQVEAEQAAEAARVEAIKAVPNDLLGNLNEL